MRLKNDICKPVIDWTPASSVSCADTFPDGGRLFYISKARRGGGLSDHYNYGSSVSSGRGILSVKTSFDFNSMTRHLGETYFFFSCFIFSISPFSEYSYMPKYRNSSLLLQVRRGLRQHRFALRKRMIQYCITACCLRRYRRGMP